MLNSSLFHDDQKLNACLNVDSAHLTVGASGDHVAKVHVALARLEGATIDGSELHSKHYGQATAAAVLRYKTKRSIINRAYQSQPDSIVGKMTIARLDQDMLAWERDNARESSEELGHEIDMLMVRLCLYPGGVCMAVQLRELKATVIHTPDPESDGATLAETGVVALLFLAIIGLLWLMMAAQRKGDQGAVARIRREVSDHITRFNRMMIVITLQGGLQAVLALKSLVRALDRIMTDTEKDIANCEQQMDPKKAMECMDEKRIVRRVLARLKQMLQNELSAVRTAHWDQTKGQLFDTLCQEIFSAMLDWKSCMGCQ